MSSSSIKEMKSLLYTVASIDVLFEHQRTALQSKSKSGRRIAFAFISQKSMHPRGHGSINADINHEHVCMHI